MDRLRLHVVGCPVLRREIECLAAEAQLGITAHWLEMGLHERQAADLHQALQAAIDAVTPDKCDVIVIAYGLCNRGIIGLQARSVPLVIPRVHDCFGMLLGSTQCYLEQLTSKPGTYFQSPGWLENSPANGEVRQPNFTFGPNSTVTREALVEKYGAENADYLLEQFAHFTSHYERLAYVQTPVPEADKWEAQARAIAERHGWKFERLGSDLGWLHRLINGEWHDREFLKLNPGERVVLRYDTGLIGAESSAEASKEV